MPFQFRVIPLRPGIKNLALEIRHHGLVVARDEPSWELTPNMEIDIPIGFRPALGSFGKVTFRVCVSYHLNGERRSFSNRLVFTIYRAQERAAKVLENLRIDITNNVTVDRAGDARVSNALNEMRELFRGRANDPISDFNLYDTPEIWAPLVLWRESPDETSSPLGPHDTPPTEAVLGRISLRLDNTRLHLISNSVIQIGRSSECDVVTRLPVSPNQPPGRLDPNYRISRFHCRIALENTGCCLFDKAWDPRERIYRPSTHGTYLDGQRVPSGGAVNLPEGRDALISLAGDGTAKDEACLLHVRLWKNGDWNRPPRCAGREFNPDHCACLVLKPQFRPHDVYLLLWERIDLWTLREEWRGLCLCCRDKAFRIGLGDRCLWLVPGARFDYRQQTIEVFQYNARDAATTP